MTEPALQTDASARRRLGFTLLGGVLVILTGWVLHAMAAVLVPIFLALFVALAAHPLDRRVARAMPRGLAWLGRAAVMGILLLVLAVFLGGLALAAQQIAEKLPDLSTNLGALMTDDSPGRPPESLGERLQAALSGAGGSLGSWLVESGTGLARQVANATGGLIAAMVLVFFLVLLILSETGRWSQKLQALAPAGGGAGWRQALEHLGATLRRFILVRTFIGVISALAYLGWLALFGMDLLLVWALLTFLLTYIPNLGSLLSGIFPVLYALFTRDLGTALLIGAGLFVIEQAVGNFLDPVLQGHEIALSPLVILVAILLWGWIWGAAGAFLAVPMTLTIMTLANTVPALRPVALVLSNQPSQAKLDDALGTQAADKPAGA